ncbi:MAG: hypothetical protein RLO12_01300, partial [Fulvivirga sp.]
FSFNCFCQSRTPDYTDYLNNTYQTDTVKYEIEEDTVFLIKAYKEEKQSNGLLWIQYTHSHPKFLGYIESESGFYVPKNQPIKNCFLIVQAKEYNGIIHLIRKEGEWTEIPGYYYGISGSILYTKATGDGNLHVASYNYETGELFTKVYNNNDGEDPWNIFDNYNYEDISWITIP